MGGVCRLRNEGEPWNVVLESLEDVDPKRLEVKDEGMEPPPMVGALVKNEQDMQRIAEYLHAASKRGGRTW